MFVDSVKSALDVLHKNIYSTIHPDKKVYPKVQRHLQDSFCIFGTSLDVYLDQIFPRPYTSFEGLSEIHNEKGEAKRKSNDENYNF